jgi:DNA-directed RNA polymerase subunit M/transcription elongation factor TFIIS
MNSSGTCSSCRNAEVAKVIPETANAIGDEVVISTTVGRGYDQTVHTFYQCADCGSVWVTYVESGAGGHGRFHERLTKSLF